jgi:dipeptidyl-peptidase-4
VSVASDGSRVVFLRAGQLWVYEVAGGRERLVAAPSRPGVSGYATDALARTAVFGVRGRLYRADLVTGAVAEVPTAGTAGAATAGDPRPDPTGQRLGYLAAGALHIVEAGDPGPGQVLAGEPDPAYGGHPYVTWGQPDPAAAGHFRRRRGWWWAPHGRAVLAARVDHARPRPEVSLHLLDLLGGWVDVHWDRETYPYLVSVCWADHPDPLIAVLRRPQQHGLVLAVDARTGETQVHAELADPRWVEPVPGTPCHLADGRVLVGGELAHDGYDARCLFADGTLLTPPSLYVRRVVGKLPGGSEILVEGSAGEPSEQHLFRVATTAGAGGIDARQLTTTPGWHRAAVGGDTLATGSRSLEHAGTRWTVWHGDQPVGQLSPLAPGPAPAGGAARAGGSGPVVPHPQLARVTDRKLPTGVLYPRAHVSGRRLPVLVDAAGLAQGVRAVRADWLPRQVWADAGFAVVVVDHRGTPGIAPSFEKVVHRRLGDLALADLTDALAALAGKHPDLDLDRVAMRGRGVGGWLAVLAVLRRPETFRCAVAEAPLVDWLQPGPAYAERYLGAPDDGTEVYQHHSLLSITAEPPGPGPRRPVLLAPDRANDRPVRQLGSALAAAGWPYTVTPAAAGVDEFRRAELDFLRQHLAPPAPA